MDERFVDLHVHTNASDGTFTPEELVKKASKIGFSAISITDHDTVNGIEEAVKCSKEYKIEVIPGVELSCDLEGTEIHMLGYFVNYKDESFVSYLKRFFDARYKRADGMVNKLKKSGVDISMDDILKLAGKKSAIGRLHIAQVLYKAGYVTSIADAFRKYLHQHSSYYVDKYSLAPHEAVEIIRNVKGIAVFGHPGVLGKDNLIALLKKSGLEGIEVYHTEHTKKQSKRYIELAKEYDLLVTGGSDCHGKAKDKILLGKVKLDYKYLKDMRDYRNEKQ